MFKWMFVLEFVFIGERQVCYAAHLFRVDRPDKDDGSATYVGTCAADTPSEAMNEAVDLAWLLNDL